MHFISSFHHLTLPYLDIYTQDNVLLGTKCNKLINLNLKTGKHFEIRRPPRPLRTFSTLSDDWGNCGIHSITMNPSGDLIATGGTDPADCDIIRTANWTPVATLVGHRDWLFGAAWVTDRHVVTGSRDGSVALWDVNFACGPDGPAFAPGNGDEAQQITWAPIIEYSYHNPQHMKRKFGGRVRDIKFEPEQRLVAALDTDGVIKVMDPASGLRIVRTVCACIDFLY
jgi:WD repeat-containing protein 40A